MGTDIVMAFGYTKAPNKYIVKWQELVTYEVEVEAYDEDEAMDLAQCDYGHDNEVDCSYWDGSMQINLVLVGEVEEDPDYGYKLSMEERDDA